MIRYVLRGEHMPIERQKEIKRRRNRKKKMKKLRARLAIAKDLETKEMLIAKIKKIQPNFEE